jgi:hypothetical protein
MDEGFVYAIWWELNDYENLSSWFNPITYINAMARDSATGKIFLAENGAIIPDNLNSTTLAEIAQNVNYCYAATILAMNGANCYFGYNAGTYYTYNAGVEYMPNMNTNLGSPSDMYYQSQGVYMRDFTGSIVLFNPSANYYNVTLGQNYYLTNDTIVSSIILSPWSGEILLSHV